MNQFISTSWWMFGILAFVVILKLVFPTEPKLRYFVLGVFSTAAIIYAIIFLFSLNDKDSTSIWSLIYMVICCVIIYLGGASVEFKSMDALFDSITNKPICKLSEGSLNWAIPFLEERRANFSLKDKEIKIPETQSIQTQTKGIQAKVKLISFMLRLKDDGAKDLLSVYGGEAVIHGRIIGYVHQFFNDEVEKLTPEELDQNKGNRLRQLANSLKSAINKFCNDNNFPYLVPSGTTITIGDTELDESYYSALAKKQIAILTQEALDIDSNALLARLIKVGKELLKSTAYSDADRLQAAQISLGIVKKEIKFNKIGIDPDSGELLKALAELLRKK